MRKHVLLSFSMLTVFSFLVPRGAAGADLPPRMSPVTSMSVSYNLKNSSLHVEAAHPSSNWEIDYVRMMTVAVNGQVVSTYNYYHQTKAEGFSEDVPLSAQAGDVITAVVYCTVGSSMSQDLTVTAPDASPSGPSTGPGNDNSTTQ